MRQVYNVYKVCKVGVKSIQTELVINFSGSHVT